MCELSAASQFKGFYFASTVFFKKVPEILWDTGEEFCCSREMIIFRLSQKVILWWDRDQEQTINLHKQIRSWAGNLKGHIELYLNSQVYWKELQSEDGDFTKAGAKLSSETDMFEELCEFLKLFRKQKVDLNIHI